MATWRDAGQWHRGHLYLWQPDTVFSSQVHADTLTSGRYLASDTWWLIKPDDTTNITDCTKGMTITLGTASGERDLGVARILGVTNDATLGYCLTVWASPGRNWGELDVQEDAYITVLDLRQPWALMQQILTDGSVLKDGIYSNVYNQLLPVANGGPAYAGEVDSITGVITVDLSAANSFATAPGGSIASQTWNVGDGTITVGTGSSEAITATFPPGQRYVELEVTDDAAETRKTYVPVVGTGFTIGSEISYAGASYDQSDYYDIYDASYLFDGTASPWNTAIGSTIGWASITLTAAVTIGEYTLKAQSAAMERMPNTWVLEYLSGAEYLTADSVSGETGWGVNEERTFTLDTPITATTFRLTVTANDGDPDVVAIAEMGLYSVSECVELTTFEVLSRTLRPEGQTVSFRVYDAIPATTYPYGTLVLYWEDEYYGDTQTSLYGPTGREHMRFVGWIANEPTRIESAESGVISYVDLECKDIAGWLAQLPGFPFVLARDAAPDNFDQLIGLNIDRYVWFLLQWHSTALDLAPFTWSGTGETYAVSTLGSQGASLYLQADTIAQAADCRLTCDSFGRLAMVSDPIRQPTADRTSTVLQALTAADLVTLNYTEQRPSSHHWLWLGGIQADTTDADVLSGDKVGTFFCRAPGATPGQGLAFVQRSEMIVADQDDLNERAGHQYARLNADQSLFDALIVPGNDGGIEPAYMQWVTLTLTSAYAAPRGETYATERMLPFSVSYTYNADDQSKEAHVLIEREIDGPNAVTYIPDTGSSVVTTPDTGPSVLEAPYELSGQDNIFTIHANGYVSYTSNFNDSVPDYTVDDLSLDGTILDAVTDAYSPKYLGTGDTVNAWIVTTTTIYYVEDITDVSSRTVTDQHTFAVESDYRTIQTERGTQDWVIVASFYPTAGTKAAYTTNGGTTWTEVVVSSETGGTAGGYTAPATAPYATFTGSYTNTGEGDAYTYSATAIDSGFGVRCSVTWPAGNFMSQSTNNTMSIDRAGTITSFKLLIEPAGGLGIPFKDWWTPCFPDADETYGWRPRFTRGGTEFFPSSTYADGDGYVCVYTTSVAGLDKFGGLANTYRGCPSTSFPGGTYTWDMHLIEFNGETTLDPATTLEVTPSLHVSGKTAGLAYVSAVTASGTGDLYVTDDYGATWALASTPDHDYGDYLAGTFCFPWENNTNELLYYYGKLDATLALYRTSADGTTSTEITPSGDYGPDEHKAIHACANNRQWVGFCGTNYASDAVGVFYSIDAGATWTTVVSPVARSSAYIGIHVASDLLAYMWGPAGIAVVTGGGAAVVDRTGDASTSEVIGIGGW